MPLSAPTLQKLELERADLGRRLKHLHGIICIRHPEVARVALAVYDAATDRLSTFISSNADGEALTGYETRMAEVPSLQQLSAERSNRVIHDLDALPDTGSGHSRWLRAHGYRASYTLPMFKDEALAGFLFFNARTPGVFTPETTASLDDFADILMQLYLMRLSAVSTLVGAVHMVTGLARLRDVETGEHLERIAGYVRLIARGVARQHQLSDEFIEYLHLFAPLHDIGKVGIPDRILQKPGKLDAEEAVQMRQHVAIGVGLVDHIVADLGFKGELASAVMHNVVAGHHERLDGSGYPAGLQGDDIPIEARITAVADVYDALSSVRPYKTPWSEERCIAELQAEVARGRLDRDCVQALLDAEAERLALRERLSGRDAAAAART